MKTWENSTDLVGRALLAAMFSAMGIFGGYVVGVVLIGIDSGVPNDLTLLIGLGTTLLTFLLFLCTGMIYACIKFLQEWATWLTVVNYTLFGLASGFLLATAYAALQVVLIDVAARGAHASYRRGYAANPRRRYPVLYVLHGIGGLDTDWTAQGAAVNPEDVDGFAASVGTWGGLTPLLYAAREGYTDAATAYTSFIQRYPASSRAPAESTNALRQTSDEPNPERVRRSFHVTPSRLMKDLATAGRGESSLVGCSTGIGVREPGLRRRTATTKSAPVGRSTGGSHRSRLGARGAWSSAPAKWGAPG